MTHVLSYFYNLAGKRLAEALTHLNWDVEICQSGVAPQSAHYDCGFLINIDEIIFSIQKSEDAKTYLSQIRRYCTTLVSFAMEAVGTPWFERILRFGQEAGVDYLLDTGLHSQLNRLPSAQQARYRFLFNGLTNSERAQVADQPPDLEKRPIPWAFVAHLTSTRMDFARRLISEVHPAGFLYLVRPISPVSKDGHHLNEEQFKSVLQRSRLQVWCSHHENPYLEGERFRTSLLTGSLPFKILLHSQKPEEFAMFQYLLLNENEFAAQIARTNLPAAFKRFTGDFFKMPSLDQSLQTVMDSIGYPTRPGSTIIVQ